MSTSIERMMGREADIPTRRPPGAEGPSESLPARAPGSARPAGIETDIEPVALRSALGMFATGVTVVTASVAGQPILGMTVNSFSSVSLDPPLVLWSLRTSSASLAAVRRTSGFVVNILSTEQVALVDRFSRPAADRFEGVSWRQGRHGPILVGALAHFDCSHHAQYEAGDHVILLGRVHACETAEGAPLVYWRGRSKTGGAH